MAIIDQLGKMVAKSRKKLAAGTRKFNRDIKRINKGGRSMAKKPKSAKQMMQWKKFQQKGLAKLKAGGSAISKVAKNAKKKALKAGKTFGKFSKGKKAAIIGGAAAGIGAAGYGIKKMKDRKKVGSASSKRKTGKK